MSKRYCILSDGVWYRPQNTPCGKAGWIAEITFYTDPQQPRLSPHKNIQQHFETREEAEKFLGSKLHSLYQLRNTRICHYANRNPKNSF